MSERKDYEIKAGERILKEAAWDCPFNYPRNIRPNDATNCEVVIIKSAITVVFRCHQRKKPSQSGNTRSQSKISMNRLFCYIMHNRIFSKQLKK